MFPTIDYSVYQLKNKRRPRSDPNNRDYICPCGKSYLSYPALFTHIKTKHNGRAPGQIIKPRNQNSGRRGRPSKICDSQSQTEDYANNALDRFCDFITDFQKVQGIHLKQIYTKMPFYDIFINFNQQEQELKYIESEDIYEETCANVFSQFLAQANKRIIDPFHVDLVFMFVCMIAKGINEQADNEDKVKEEIIRDTAKYSNDFFMKHYPKYVQSFKIQKIELFMKENMGVAVQLFYGWLTTKKYINFKVKMNQQYFES